jgi:LEA14-like dessication related protein
MSDGLAMAVAILLASSAFGAPRIACDEPVKDFGAVDNNTQSLVHAFALHNRGDAPLNVLGIHSSCGCTTATVGDKTVAPGSSTLIRAVLTLQGRKGPQRKPVHITTNDPMTPQFDLTIACDIRLPIDAEPSGFFFTPTVAASNATERTVRVSAVSNVTFRIVGVDTSTVTRADIEVSEEETGRVFAVTARLRPTAASGYTREEVVVRTDHAAIPRIVLPLVVFVPEEVSVVPTEMFLTPTALTQSPLRREVLLRVAGTNAWTIADVRAEGGFTMAETNRGPRRSVFDLSDLGRPADLPGKRILIKARCETDGRERDFAIPLRLWTPRPVRPGLTP